MRSRVGFPTVVGMVVTVGSAVSACSGAWEYVGPGVDGGAADPGDDGGRSPGAGGSGSSGGDQPGSSGVGVGGSTSSSGLGSGSSGVSTFGGSSSTSSGVSAFGGSSSGGSSSSGGGESSSGASSSGGTRPSGSSGSSSGGGGSSSGSSLIPTCPKTTGAAPSWSSIWDTDGFSTTCKKCHSAELTVFGNPSTPSAAYEWLQNGGYIMGTQSQIVEVGCSPLALFGGNMPPAGNSVEAAAKCALVDWVAAGALNN